MAKFCSVPKINPAADPRDDYKTVNDLIDFLNNMTVTITPSDAGIAKMSEGDIQLDLDAITSNDAIQSIPGYAPPGSSEQSTGSSDDSSNASGGAD